MARDQARVDAIQAALKDEGLDVLACALPANVLLLTGYWPVVGTAVALAARGGPTVVLAPRDEEDLARQGWADEVHTFEPASLADLRDAEQAVHAPLAEAARRLGAGRARVGYERGGSFEPCSYASMHLYGSALVDLLGEVFGSAPAPADEMLARLRSVKTPHEVERIRAACGLAGEAFKRAAAELRAGLRETEAAAFLQSALATGGPGGAPPGRAFGFAWCMSGANSALAFRAYARSSERHVHAGEPVLLHCNSTAGGYWTDVTRTYTLGGAEDRLEGVYEAVLEARRAALEAIRPGARASAVDAAARSVLAGRGYGAAFKHSTGHGVGFAAINHNARPRLHPRSDEVLRANMVFNVEPGVYLEGYGGVRHCDVVAVGPSGAEVLTPFQSAAGELILR